MPVKKSFIFMTILVLACSTAAMAAGGEKGDWELGLYGGAALMDDYIGLSPKDSGLLGARLGFFFTPHFSLEASGQRIFTKSEITIASPLAGTENFDLDIDALRLNGLWTFRAGERTRPFLTIGGGYEKVTPDGFDSNTDLGWNAGGGVRFFCGEHFSLRIDGRMTTTDFSRGDTSERQGNIEASVGASWVFGGAPPKDTDGDGVTDRKDKCPDTPHGCLVDEVGCPKDADGDGVCDGLDACPDTPKGCPVDARGCPLDSDGDGVIDCKDTCPSTPKGATVDANGCPKDTDGDGVFDGVDRCPDTKKGCRVDAAGCPMDGDGDGVCDGLDRCPDTPRGKKVDENGCPTPEPLFEGRKELILKGVNFDTDKWNLDDADKAILDPVAVSLNEWPDVKVEVQGHTDSSGGDKHNLDLSQKRAQSVMDYLVSKGVNAARLTAKGYGETKPIADNKTKEGRAENRRVELDKVE